MTSQISAEQMARYRRTARARWQKERTHREMRRQRAWQLARQAATLLKSDYDVQRVLVFGSLADPDRFTQWSDVDLAAWGLNATNWLRAIGAVRQLSDEIEINLVDVASASPELLEAIERGGTLVIARYCVLSERIVCLLSGAAISLPV